MQACVRGTDIRVWSMHASYFSYYDVVTIKLPVDVYFVVVFSYPIINLTQYVYPLPLKSHPMGVCESV